MKQHGAWGMGHGRGSHANSREAHHGNRYRDRYAAIMEGLRLEGPGTDREIKERLGLPDMNNVRPRITELVGMLAVREVGTKTCPVTGKPVRIIGLREPSPQARDAWRHTCLAAPPHIRPAVADQLDLGI